MKLDYIGRLPIVLFCFLVLFLFDALGSILVLLKKSSFSGVPLVSTEYVLMLVGQACLFYLIVGPYALRKSHMAGRHLEVRPLAIQTADRWFTVVLAASIVFVLTLYYQEVGSFLIFDLFSGQLHTHTALPLRMKTSYGLEHFFLYRFGFFVFPALLAGLLTLMCLIERRFGIGRAGLFLFCLLPPLLLAEKAGVLWIGLNVMIGYVPDHGGTAASHAVPGTLGYCCPEGASPLHSRQAGGRCLTSEPTQLDCIFGMLPHRQLALSPFAWVQSKGVLRKFVNTL